VHAYVSKAFHEVYINVEDRAVISDETLHGRHSHVDTAYMKQVEEACLEDVRVKAEIEKLRLPKEAVVIVEPWTYATDGMNDMKDRITVVRNSTLIRERSSLTFLSAGSTCGSATIQMPTITATRSKLSPRSQKLFR
jgi:Cu2+-containing amine oxidase